MKKFITLVGLVLLLSGCVDKADTSHRTEAQSLYFKSKTLFETYIKRMSESKDSSALLNLTQQLDKELTDLNYSYPAETDLGISEAENDTLKNLTMQFVSLRDSLLYLYAHPAVPSDSVAGDSLQSRPVSEKIAIKQSRPV